MFRRVPRRRRGISSGAPSFRCTFRISENKKSDICYVAEVRNRIIGAVWVRIMNDYGHIDDKTPSFAVSILKQYRNRGIGTELMKRMLTALKEWGYKQASLAVQKENYAVKMYKKVGFEIIDENTEEYIMLCRLQ